MKSERYAPWLYISAAILVFVLVIVVSASITSALDTSQAIISWDQLFGPRDTHSIYVPILSGGNQSEEATISQNASDNGVGLQDWDESQSP